jgi:hypothetical protein
VDVTVVCTYNLLLEQVFCPGYFGNGGLMNYLPSLALILLTSASEVARIAGMSHQPILLNLFMVAEVCG